MYGKIFVKNVKNHIYPNYTIRTFKVSNGEVLREVKEKLYKFTDKIILMKYDSGTPFTFHDLA